MLNRQYDIRIFGGNRMAEFLTKLKSSGTKITLLTLNDGNAYFRTDKIGVKNVRKYRRRYGLTVKISSTGKDPGLSTLFSSFRYVIVFIIPFLLSFFLWSVKVDSDFPEVADRIEEKLVAASIVPFKPLVHIPGEDEIRRYLMQDDPSLSWVRFRRVGTSLTVIPMLSPASDIQIESEGPPSDLVARTGGVITRFELKKGERVGNVFMTVKKGDILATGLLEQGDETVIVGAEGEVFADYWIEYSFSLPKVLDYTIQGEEEVFIEINLPWKNKTEFDRPFWQIFTTKRHISEKYAQLELVEGMEQTMIVPLIKRQLLAEHGSEAIIKDDKVLHVTFENDKVNGTILFLMNDNIAMKRPIPQGD